MTCRTSRYLLHLDRPGERSKAETAGLLKHLAGCPTCAAEAASAVHLHEVESCLRRSAGTTPDLSDVHGRVLVATARPARRQSVGMRSPRFAYGLALAAVMAWFGAGQWQIRSTHAALRERQERGVSAPAGPQIVYSIDARHARQLTVRAGSLPADLGTVGKLEVPQSTVREWIENAPAYLAPSLTSRHSQRVQFAEALKVLQTVADVTIRYRHTGE